MNMVSKSRGHIERMQGEITESCEMQKTYKEKDQKSDQTVAAVCKAGSEICERVSGGGEGTSDAYNKCETLQGAIERYYERTGHYPERVLGDKIYRNRENLA